MNRRQSTQRLAEIALVFAVFFIQGAWPTPEVNEPNYLGKAIHFWNPGLGRTRFLPQHRRHPLGLLLHLRLAVAMDGAGGLGVVRPALTWALMAWAWRRLSFAVAREVAGPGHCRPAGGDDPARQPRRRMAHRRR